MTYEFLNWFAELGQLTGVVTFVVTVLGMFSLLLVNIGRYLQSQKFGIPLRKVHQANIAESAELWISLLGSIGFGVLLPIVFLSIDLSRFFLVPILFVFFNMGLLMTKHGGATGHGNKVVRDGKEYQKVYNITLLLYTLQSLPAAFAYMRLHRHYYEVFVLELEMAGGAGSLVLSVFMVLALVLYFYRLFKQLYKSWIDRLFGNVALSTTEIDGKKYFVAMRHNVYQWFLMEYEVLKYSKTTKIGIVKYDTEKFVATFTRGKYIIKDLSELDTYLETKSFDEVRDKNKRGVFTYEYEVGEEKEGKVASYTEEPQSEQANTTEVESQ